MIINKGDIIDEPILKDMRCSIDEKFDVFIYGDYYIGAENNYNPIRKVLKTNMEGLFRLQEEINQAIKRIVKK